MKYLFKLACDSLDLVQEEIIALSKKKEISWLTECMGIFEMNHIELEEISNSSAVMKFIIIDPILLNHDEVIDLGKQFRFPDKHLNSEYIPNEATFVVRHQHTGSVDKKLPTEEIERTIGASILNGRQDLKVNLTMNDKTYMIISWKDGSVMGWIHKTVDYKPIASRAPKMSPYFRGGGMKSRLCRLLVNLLFPLNNIILDPFCGHGGILREIADLGSFGIGIEINKKLCRELLANNRHFGYDDRIGIIMGDSLMAPLRKNAYKQVATDPPYAIQTTTKGLDPSVLLNNWLSKQENGVKLVFTTPKTMLVNLSEQWTIEIDKDDFVHKSLTRRVRRVIKGGSK
ncbi:MAG: tRNA (guanine(10)-N2)-dimethyltransferase [Candidatus Heimdallarchaeota archaeon LC_2]|nr:MAG: tRNA (guanine(10)-N2)-dimethyltransferase [Candidatus Heimdallarchaeota archaeon LC_2]